MGLKSEKTKDILVLTSGGLDSTCCLAYYLRDKRLRPTALFIDYGQAAAEKETVAAENVCLHYGVPLQKVSIKGLGMFRDGYIKGRNAFLLLTGLTYFKYSYGLISIGLHAGTNYPDCTEQFVWQLQDVFNVYSDGKIIIDTPFLQWSKLDIWNFCFDREVPVNLTYSCEAGTNPPCGICLSCGDMKKLYAEH